MNERVRDTIERMAWAIRVRNVGEDAARRSKDKMHHGWTSTVEDARVAYEALTPRLEDEVRAMAEDTRYSNELLGITVRNWFHRQEVGQ